MLYKAKTFNCCLRDARMHVCSHLLLQELVEAEKRDPHSQNRVPNENLPLLWAQSLWLIGLMLYEGLLTKEEIDPLGGRIVVVVIHT